MQADEAGGLACTDITPEGFLFDMGGHVIFSHWNYFDQLIDAAMGSSGPSAWNTLERVSYVWMDKRYVAYPFQNNISALNKDQQVCPCDQLTEGCVPLDDTPSLTPREPHDARPCRSSA